MVLEVETNAWPFLIPLVKLTNGWQFDTQAGIEEFLNRRVGRNELEALRTIPAYVDANANAPAATATATRCWNKHKSFPVRRARWTDFTGRLN